MDDATRSGYSQIINGDDRQTSLPETETLQPVEFDNVLNAIGPSLKYQCLQIVMCLTFFLPYALALFNFVFIGYEPPHVCAETNETELLAKYSPLNSTTASLSTVYEMCRIKIISNETGHPEEVMATGCINGYNYEGGKDVSLKTEWDLVCDKDGVGEMVQTTFKLGMTIAITVSPLPDKFGRKPVIVILGVISTVVEVGVAFAPSVYAVIILKMVSGIAIQNISSIAYVLGTELLVTKHRETYATISLIVWACCIISLGGISYALMSYSWRVLQLVTSLTGIPPLLFAYSINESLPWLFAKGRHRQALNILKQACVTNDSDFRLAEHAYNECVLRLERIHESRDHKTPESTTAAVYGFLDIIRHRKLLITTLILCLAMFTHNVTYDGLYLTSATFQINRFLMFMILSGIEIPACFVFLILLSYIGRRTIVLIFLSTTAICLLVSTCLVGLGSSGSDHVSNASEAFFVLGKFAIDMSYNCVSSFLVEHYPTTLRSVGPCICVCVARIGGMASPFLYPLFVLVNWAPGAILVTICFVTVSLYTLVPETKGRELPTTIEAAEASVQTKKGKANERH